MKDTLYKQWIYTNKYRICDKNLANPKLKYNKKYSYETNVNLKSFLSYVS